MRETKNENMYLLWFSIFGDFVDEGARVHKIVFFKDEITALQYIKSVIQEQIDTDMNNEEEIDQLKNLIKDIDNCIERCQFFFPEVSVYGFELCLHCNGYFPHVIEKTLKEVINILRDYQDEYGDEFDNKEIKRLIKYYEGKLNGSENMLSFSNFKKMALKFDIWVSEFIQ
jgi:hypothetical protein